MSGILIIQDGKFIGRSLVILCRRQLFSFVGINKTLTYNLISEGYDTISALNAGTAAELLTQTEYDLVLLGIPYMEQGFGRVLCV